MDGFQYLCTGDEPVRREKPESAGKSRFGAKLTVSIKKIDPLKYVKQSAGYAALVIASKFCSE
jgi:hypothetical protein